MSLTTVAAARRLANAQGPGDTDGDPRRTPDFCTAVSSAITGAFQRWRLYTGFTSEESSSRGAKQRSRKGRDRSGIESASTCQIAACSNSRRRRCRHGNTSRDCIGARRDVACGRRPDEYRTDHHLDHRADGYCDAVCQPPDASSAATRIRIRASDPRVAVGQHAAAHWVRRRLLLGDRRRCGGRCARLDGPAGVSFHRGRRGRGCPARPGRGSAAGRGGQARRPTTRVGATGRRQRRLWPG